MQDLAEPVCLRRSSYVCRVYPIAFLSTVAVLLALRRILICFVMLVLRFVFLLVFRIVFLDK